MFSVNTLRLWAVLLIKYHLTIAVIFGFSQCLVNHYRRLIIYRLYDCDVRINHLNRSIFYVKTHKTASATTTNILIRYGLKKNLTLVLPLQDNYIEPYHYLNAKTQILPPLDDGHGFDMLVGHSRFIPQIRNLLVHPFVFASLRNPVDQFPSAYSFLDLTTRYGVNMSEFLENPRHYYQFEDVHARNVMLYDLGLDQQYFDDMNYIKNYTDWLLMKLDFIIIQEYYEESIIMLRDKLGFDFNDILTVYTNERLETAKIKHFSNITIERLKTWNAGDVYLYEQALNVFNKQLKAYGEQRMRKDMETLRIMTENLNEFCTFKKTHFKHLFHSLRDFRVENPIATSLIPQNNAKICKLIAMPEQMLWELLRHRHRHLSSKYNIFCLSYRMMCILMIFIFFILLLR